MREDRSVLDLLRANYTFLNERLAKHYGIPERVRQPVPPRDVRRRARAAAGCCGRAACLTVTSYANRTSPVIRGKWILANLLGVPPPPPPGTVPPLKETAGRRRTRSLDARAAGRASRRTRRAAGCHADGSDRLRAGELRRASAAGARRRSGRRSTRGRVCPTAPSSTASPALQRRRCWGGPKRSSTTFTEKLLTYALGRGVESLRRAGGAGIVRQAAAKDYRFSSFVLGIVNSTPFQMRRAQ